MHARKLHLHSMLVHALLALVPVAAAAFLLEAAGVTIGRFGPELWRFLLVLALGLVLLLALPVTLSGILERRHLYVTWHRTHRLKLVLSAALVALVAGELRWLLGGSAEGLVGGAAVVVVNTVIAGLLSALGLKMTLGRQSFAATSYRPDLFSDRPVDALALAAAHLSEPADVIDVMGEVAR